MVKKSDKRDQIAERLDSWRDAINREKSDNKDLNFPAPVLTHYWEPGRGVIKSSTEPAEAVWGREFTQLKSSFEAWCKGMAMSPALYQAAVFLGLDLKNETEKAALLGILADIVFRKSPKGAPKKHTRKWSRFRLVRLAVDLEKMKEGAPGLSDRMAADLLKKKFPNRYGHNSAEIIRQNLRHARRWLDNARRIRADRQGRTVE